MADKITINDDHTLNVSDNPIIPFIEGDGTGIDIWPAAKHVLDAAAAKYGKTIEWMEVLAGEKAFNETGDWLPQETVDNFNEYLIGIKGPLTTPIGGGFRSLNVALRQLLDLYVCLRPVRWFEGVPSPVKTPELVDMVIFRENTEDIYAGIEAEAFSDEAKKIRDMVMDVFGREISEDSGIGIKPVSKTGSQRLQRAALNYAVKKNRKAACTARAQGQHHEVHRGRLPEVGLRAGDARSSDRRRGRSGKTAAGMPGDKILVQDAIADIALQQVLTRGRRVRRDRHHEPQRRLPLRRAAPRRSGAWAWRPERTSTTSPTIAFFEATHGTAPKYAGQDKVNPSLADPLGRDDARAPRLAGGRRRHHQRGRGNHRGEDRHVRLCSPDGRRHRGQVLGVRIGDRRSPLISRPRSGRPARSAPTVRPACRPRLR